VRDEDTVQSFEADPGLQDLALGPLAAIHQEAEFIVHHYLRGQIAPGGGGRGRCT